jgi:hydrogenase maturation protein HypF
MLRRRYVYRGTIQGVGFRPAVYRAASGLGLSGFVRNLRSEVLVEVQGDAGSVQEFPAAFQAILPAAARIESVREADIPPDPRGPPGFRIAVSGSSPYSFPPVPPDLALCPDCRRELLDPADRRYLYPFITCTQCGPRYSILTRTPFDREATSMEPFTQCPDCLREYGDPGDRRFHSQTNSCPACGPRLRCIDGRGREVSGSPVAAAVGALREGLVVAVQGVGGFHLAADPAHPRAMARLRRTKERESKPFALMVRDMTEARALCRLTPQEEGLLCGAESPIVISPCRKAAALRPGLQAVSDTGTLGIMLPYTPLHVLLFELPGEEVPYRSLVMTSGNRANEPIETDPAEALRSLSSMADLFLVHDRRIAARTDDSIVRAGPAAGAFLLRRSRGFVPRLITAAAPVEGVVLGLGGDLKSAPALARGTDIQLSPYLGDLDDQRSFAGFEAQVHAMQDMYGVKPDRIVHDMHPLYWSTRWAGRQADADRHAVQHHFAHILSVMAEHGLDEAVGLSFDGTGYGSDGTVWGGEFLHATRSGFRRLGHVAPFGLPGGEAAVLHPLRIAYSILGPRLAEDGGLGGMDGEERGLVRAMIEKGLNCPACTSLGRVFDAAAAILGLVGEATWEGEGPIRMEGAALAESAETGQGLSEQEALELLPFGEEFSIDPRPLLARLLAQRGRRPVGELALLFHQAVALAGLEGARRMRQRTGVRDLALSGGVFQNLLLRELLVPLLQREGFRVFLNQKAPPGDGGISVGQVWYQPADRPAGSSETR